MSVVGGLSVATLFTLVVVPVAYTLVDDVRNRFWKDPPKVRQLVHQRPGNEVPPERC
jgi:hypothetical protein